MKTIVQAYFFFLILFILADPLLILYHVQKWQPGVRSQNWLHLSGLAIEWPSPVLMSPVTWCGKTFHANYFTRLWTYPAHLTAPCLIHPTKWVNLSKEVVNSKKQESILCPNSHGLQCGKYCESKGVSWGWESCQQPPSWPVIIQLVIK